MPVDPVPVDIVGLQAKELRIETVFRYANVYYRAISLIAAGKVDLLVILGGNPVYTAPADLQFAKALEKVQVRVHLSDFEDETSALCQWQIPAAHFLESWGDARAFDGTASLILLVDGIHCGNCVQRIERALHLRGGQLPLERRDLLAEDGEPHQRALSSESEVVSNPDG